MPIYPYKPTDDFQAKLPDELNFWAARVAEKVRKNFFTLSINRKPGQKGRRYTGDLYRSVYWTVHSAAGGNQAYVDFFYLKYGQFVEWGVGGHVKYTPLPEMQAMKPINREGTTRKAKPFMRSELRFHIRWLRERLFDQYNFAGTFYLLKAFADALGDQSITDQWISEHRAELDQAGMKFV